ncbi:MAG: MFS transporter [bacterium]
MLSLDLPSPAVAYVRWSFMRAIFHRGWWLVTSLYLVVDAQLSPLQLVSLGTAQALTVLIFEIPTGVVADNYSRKWSIVVAHLLMGSAMLTTGLVTSFPALVATQMVWGLSWTFSSGADVAWITDELDDPEKIVKVLSIAARWGLLGAALGLCLFGGLAWLTNLATAIVLAGGSMLILGTYVAVRFTETRLSPSNKTTLSEFWTTLKSGSRLATSDRPVMLILVVTFLVNGADEAFGRLIPKSLIELGLPSAPDPIVWLTTLGLATLGVGALTLRILEHRMRGNSSLRLLYLGACMLGASGLLLFALAPSPLIAMAGVLVVHGIAFNVVRMVGIIWMNDRSTSDVRATMQSFLSQAENFGEMSIGFCLGVIAQLYAISSAMFGAVVVVAIAACLIFSKQNYR